MEEVCGSVVFTFRGAQNFVTVKVTPSWERRCDQEEVAMNEVSPVWMQLGFMVTEDSVFTVMLGLDGELACS